MKTTSSCLLASSLLMACLSGCFSAGPKNTAVYTPSASTNIETTGQPVPWQIRIETPHASDFLESTRIAVRRKNNTLQVFEGARWSDEVPEMLKTYLGQTFNDSGKITALTGLNGNTVADALLLLDIRQFEAVYDENDKNATAVISIQAKIQSVKSNRIIASKHFLVNMPASKKKIPQVIHAFDGALQQLSQEILAWTLTADVATKK